MFFICYGLETLTILQVRIAYFEFASRLKFDIFVKNNCIRKLKITVIEYCNISDVVRNFLTVNFWGILKVRNDLLKNFF